MLDRRQFLLGASATLPWTLVGCASPAPRGAALPPPQPRRTVRLATGAKGGGFLLYGEALAAALADTPLQIQPVETQGTAENVRLLDARGIDAALLVMGPAWDAWQGQPPFAGQPVRSMRALFPMYETPFHVAATAASGIGSLAQLAGKRVGVGPARGTAEGFWRGLAEAIGLQAQIVNGSPSEQARQLAAGEIDALWFGAGLPVPAFADAAKLVPIRVFGLGDSERAAFLKRFPYFAPARIPAGTYAGQSAPVESVAVWNFASLREDAPLELGYWLTRLALERRAQLTARYPAAAATSSANLRANTFLPWHAGALRWFAENNIRT